MGYDDMEYVKCIKCRWCKEYRQLGKKGVILQCEITGKQFNLTHCKHYYGTAEKGEQYI
jgi:hypothetical protein